MRLREWLRNWRFWFIRRGVIRDGEKAIAAFIDASGEPTPALARALLQRNDCDEVPPTPKEVAMARKDEKTSKRVSSNASAALRDPKASAREKSLAGSALTQTADRKRKPPKAKAKVKAKKRAAH